MFDHILSILFPEHCRGCNKSGTALCLGCLSGIQGALPIKEGLRSYAFFDYGNTIVQQAVWELKYHHKSTVAKVLTVRSIERLDTYLSSIKKRTGISTIVLVPIPQHHSKTLSRGFNQSMLIARWLHAGLPDTRLQPLLQKNRATEAQARTHNRTEREKNLHQSMSVAVQLEKNILYMLVDDVITTGSTIHEAGRALRAAGANHVYAVALAHGYAQRK